MSLSDGPADPSNVIKITASGNRSACIRYAERVLNGEDVPMQESIVLRGMGNAIARVVNVAEIVKRRVPGLFQTVEVGTTSVEETRRVEVTEDGPVEPRRRNVSNIRITLSKVEPDVKAPGFQLPLPADMVGEEQSRLAERHPPRSSGGPARGGPGGRGAGATAAGTATANGGGGARGAGEGGRRRMSNRKGVNNRGQEPGQGEAAAPAAVPASEDTADAQD